MTETVSATNMSELTVNFGVSVPETDGRIYWSEVTDDGLG